MAEKLAETKKKMDIFCHARLDGKGVFESYQAAFGAQAHLTHATRKLKATKFNTSPAVVARMQELQSLDELAKATSTWTKEQRLAMLHDIATNSYNNGEYKTAIQAIDIGAKISADAVIRMDVSVTDKVSYSFNVLQDLAKRIDQDAIDGEVITEGEGS